MTAQVPASFQLGGMSHIRTSDMVVRVLTKFCGAASKTLEEGTTDYVVPTGKIFRILEVYLWGTATSRIDLFSSTGVDGVVAKAAKLDQVALSAAMPVIHTYFDIAEGLYINVTGNDATDGVVIVGIEMTA